MKILRGKFRKDEPRKATLEKPKPVPILTYGEFRRELVRVEAKVDKVWTPARADELARRLATINGFITDEQRLTNGLLSLEATGAINVLKKWAIKLKP